MTTTVAATDDTDRPLLRQESVPVVNLHLLSQTELYALSVSSGSSFDLNRSDDVVVPKINRAVFNESAGSRKQTYSRLRLASTDSSKTTTLHRRTPHLRLSHTQPSNSINDPEQAENSLIIRMLKQLCKSDPNFQDVAQIEEEHNTNNNPVIPELLNRQTLGVKRKRGRPRKHENVVFIRPPTTKRMRHNTTKKEVVYDDDRDREIINDRGVMVNLATLAGIEDPYGHEIRRRTVGMSTEDELLGFLRGLNGQWGSRRKKRRVVDAIEFGDVLPKGWKLSLCIKKKEGRVWLFCRRYLSPSGRQFESCREISTYLVSLIGEQNLDKPNHVNANAENLVQQEDIKGDDHVDHPSSSSLLSPSPPPPPAVTTNLEEQVTLDAMEVEDEIFKCQICHKTFNDRIAYNDHNGSHVKNEIEKIKPSPTELDSDPILMTEDNVVVETCSPHSGEKLEPVSSCINYEINSNKESNSDELHRNINMEESRDEEGKNDITTEEVSRTDQAPEEASEVSQSQLLGEVSLSVYESNTNPETFVEKQDKLDKNLDHAINSESFLLSSFPKDDNIVCDKDSVSETTLVKSSLQEDDGITANDLLSENEKVVGESSSRFLLGRFGLDKDSANLVNELSTNTTQSLISPSIDSIKPINNDTLISSKKQESPQKGTFVIESLGLDFDSFEEEIEFQNPSNKPEEPKLDEFQIFTNTKQNPNEPISSLNFTTKNTLEFSSLVPPENEQQFTFQDDVTSLYDQEQSSERGLLDHFSLNNTSDDIFENKMYSTSLDELKFDEDRDLSSNELSLAFGNPNDLFSDTIRVEPKKDVANSTKIDEGFDVHTDLSMVNNNSMVDDLKEGRGSVGGLFTLSGNGGGAWQGIKADGFKDLGNKFSGGFGSGQSHAEVVPSGMWRTGDGSQLQSGLTLTNPSHAQMPSPSSFHSFNIMSEKAGDAQFRVYERYTEGFGVSGLRSSRPEPVEFSFLTAGRSQHNPQQHQTDPRAFSYNPQMEQQFNSSYWMGKNAMMQNTSTRTQITSVCALCRYEFHLQPGHSATQDGIGPLCPSCSGQNRLF